MPVVFRKVREAYGWLSNMSPHPVRYQKTRKLPGGYEWSGRVTWPTAEALFQALRFDDYRIHKLLHTAKSPMAAKFIAKKFINEKKNVVVPRSAEDVANMLEVVNLKADQYPDLLEQLLAIPDADLPIIEDVTGRPRSESNLFWGMALDNGHWTGTNTLGEIWMEVRRAHQKGTT